MLRYIPVDANDIARCKTFAQGRPVNVKHDARCVMGKVGGRQKTQTGGCLLLREERGTGGEGRRWRSVGEGRIGRGQGGEKGRSGEGKGE